MKQKLTLTVSPAAALAARRAARQQRTSISSLFEKAFLPAPPTPGPLPSAFLDAWLADHPVSRESLPVSAADHRLAYLLGKYSKPSGEAK